MDSLVNDIKEQVSVIGTEQGKDTPAATVLSYKRDLKSLLDDGDLLTKRLIDKNGSLTERLEMLTYTAPEGSDLLSKTTSLRDRLVGEEAPYRGKFRKLRVEHESLLTGVGESGSATSTSAALPLPRSRKDYEYLKPNMLNIDCSKRELQKFITDARTWIEKTISESERSEAGIIFADNTNLTVLDY